MISTPSALVTEEFCKLCARAMVNDLCSRHHAHSVKLPRAVRDRLSRSISQLWYSTLTPTCFRHSDAIALTKTAEWLFVSSYASESSHENYEYLFRRLREKFPGGISFTLEELVKERIPVTTFVAAKVLLAFFSGNGFPSENRLTASELQSNMGNLHEEYGISHADLVLFFRIATKFVWKTQTGESQLGQDSISARSALLRVSKSGDPLIDDRFAIRVRKLLSKVLGPVPLIDGLIPGHGPGAVASGERGTDKWLSLTRLWQGTGVSPTLLTLNDHHKSELTFTYTSRPITKLICVPKDARGPRVISEEPLEMQFLQQALKGYMQKRLERSPLVPCKFESQQAHRDVLLSGGMSTIDLSDASDYLSRRLIAKVFPPEWKELLFQFRSWGMSWVGSDVKQAKALAPLRAFAPMGSALCFIVLSAVVSSSLVAAGIPVRALSVYGDDIVVRDRYANLAIRTLRLCGLKVNVAKTCVHGGFSETCGLDLVWALDGEKSLSPRAVTPVFLRHLPWSPDFRFSGVATCELLGAYGYDSTSTVLIDAMIKNMPSKYLSRVSGSDDIRGFFPGHRWLPEPSLKYKKRKELLGSHTLVCQRELPVPAGDEEFDDYAALFQSLLTLERTMPPRGTELPLSWVLGRSIREDREAMSMSVTDSRRIPRGVSFKIGWCLPVFR